MLDKLYKTAFVFPGQGSQSVGMLDYLDLDYPIVQEIFKDASDVLGYDLWELVSKDPHNQLNSTEFTQPALLAAGIACYEVFRRKSTLVVDYLAGHSLGEYSALVASGAIDFKSAISLVSNRAKLMQKAVPVGTGSMAAVIGLSVEHIHKLCDTVKNISAANINTASQIVIAGEKKQIELAAERAKQEGARRVVMLPVSVPSHCSLMDSIQDEYTELLYKINWKVPKIKVIHNFDVTIHNNPKDIINSLAKQLSSPVRWVEIIEKLELLNVNLILECGPGKILTGLNKKNIKNTENIKCLDFSQLDQIEVGSNVI